MGLVVLGGILEDLCGAFGYADLRNFEIPPTDRNRIRVDRYAETLAGFLRAPGEAPRIRPISWHVGDVLAQPLPKPLSIAGLSRVGDEVVEEFVEQKAVERRTWHLEEPSPNEAVIPVRVLELGAGVSYPGICRDLGSPWLARALQAEHGDKVEVFVSDSPGESRDARGFIELSVQGQQVCARVPSVMPSAVPSERRDSVGLYFCGEWSADGESGTVVRPALDSVFEREAFGVTVLPAIDLYRPKEGLEPGAYDIIYARHQHPRPSLKKLGLSELFSLSVLEKWRLIASRLKACVAPGGVVILHVDIPTRGTLQLIGSDRGLETSLLPFE